jgi:GTPase SAR1 family protein
LIVVGNKVDLEAERAVTAEEGKKYADSIKAPYIETSARTPINVPELFEQIAKIPVPDAPDSSTAAAQPEAEKVDLKAVVPQNSGRKCLC